MFSANKNLKSEWEIFDYYNKKNKDYLRNNITNYLLTFPEKINLYSLTFTKTHYFLMIKVFTIIKS